jgi:hypothetical protein
MSGLVPIVSLNASLLFRNNSHFLHDKSYHLHADNQSVFNNSNQTNLSFSENVFQPGTYTEEQIDSVKFVMIAIYPVLLLCCTVGNVLNLIVLAHEQPKGSTNV